MMSNHWQHESHQAKDEVQGPLQVGHAVHDADVAAGHGSVRGASPLDEGEEVEKPFEHSYGIIGRAGRDHAVGSKISRRRIGAPLSSGSGYRTSKYMSVPVVKTVRSLNGPSAPLPHGSTCAARPLISRVRRHT